MAWGIGRGDGMGNRTTDLQVRIPTCTDQYEYSVKLKATNLNTDYLNGCLISSSSAVCINLCFVLVNQYRPPPPPRKKGVYTLNPTLDKVILLIHY